MKKFLKLFGKCNHYSWEYCGERVFQHNEKDSKNRWGQVHDIIQCKYCGIHENHVNWKRHFEEHNKFLDMLRDAKKLNF